MHWEGGPEPWGQDALSKVPHSNAAPAGSGSPNQVAGWPMAGAGCGRAGRRTAAWAPSARHSSSKLPTSHSPFIRHRSQEVTSNGPANSARRPQERTQALGGGGRPPCARSPWHLACSLWVPVGLVSSQGRGELNAERAVGVGGTPAPGCSLHALNSSASLQPSSPTRPSLPAPSRTFHTRRPAELQVRMGG